MNGFDRERIDFWDEDNLSLSLFPYKPSGSGQSDEVTQLVLGFKNFDPGSFSTMCVEVCDAIGKRVEDWRHGFACRYVVPVPSHSAHGVSKSSVGICRLIAEVFPWLHYPEELLFRKHSIRPAHMALPGQRPTPQEHCESLGCSGSDLAGAGVILFDDVKTTGNTSQGCRWRLRDAGCGVVVRVFLGTTKR